MPRTRKGSARKRAHKRTLKLAKGYRGGRGRLYRTASETVTRALAYAYRDRKKRKADFRRLWIIRIGAASRQRGMTYSRFMSGLNKAKVLLDRKMLADIAVNDAPAFDKLVELAKEATG
jgi:large subunit ribosomal protein L20